MRSSFFKNFSRFSLHWWPLLKANFYIFYFFVIQISNIVDWSFQRFIVNALVYIVAIGVIEISQYGLRLFFRKRRYLRAVLIWGVNYGALAVIGYYVLHGSDNFVATEIWNRQIEASWTIFLLNFNQFYFAFFKYAVILFLIEQMLFLLRVLSFRKRTNPVRFSEMEPVPSQSIQVTNLDDIDLESSISPSSEQKDKPRKLSSGYHILPIKVGAVTYMLDVFKIVYLEVQDEITTVYQIDGSHFEAKISLSKFCELLPDHRFMRIHDSRAVALPYIIKEKKDCLYMLGYEDIALKLGSSEKYLGKYKKWKENIRSKWSW